MATDGVEGEPEFGGGVADGSAVEDAGRGDATARGRPVGELLGDEGVLAREQTGGQSADAPTEASDARDPVGIARIGRDEGGEFGHRSAVAEDGFDKHPILRGEMPGAFEGNLGLLAPTFAA